MSNRIVVGSVKTPLGVLNGVLNDPKNLIGDLTQHAVIVGNMAIAYAKDAEPYKGEYEVTPQVEGQALKTKHKYMVDDVKIKAIPFYEVSNASGGNTVFIAGEIEME